MEIEITNVWMNLGDIKNIIYTMRILLISVCTFYTLLKITNNNERFKFNINYILHCISLILFSVIANIVKNKTDSFTSSIMLVFFISILYSIATKKRIGYSLLITVFSLSINYVLFFISIIVAFIPNIFMVITNDFINLLIISITQIFLLHIILNATKIKYGISFLNKNSNVSDNIEILILNISVIIVFSFTILSNRELFLSRNIFFTFIIFASIMFITIQKSIQLYYKQKLLVQELKETKDKLEEKTKEIKELEEENIKISKKSHTLVHKQKSLEYKIEGLIGKTEISKEEVGELTNRIKEINKELYKQKIAIELDKTEIQQIDDMLKYMQSECKKNNIDFELQIKGSIHHMTNNLISKEDLEALLADHIKNAIIAINHGNNINRSILVRIGKIDECYGLYIYDSGIEFEKETLKNLGKKPSTTHANEGGTGMGFMNTFDTLKKCNASLIIEEYNEPSKDNYTKVIKIKFNNKNEFEIKTYREKSTI